MFTDINLYFHRSRFENAPMSKKHKNEQISNIITLLQENLQTKMIDFPSDNLYQAEQKLAREQDPSS